MRIKIILVIGLALLYILFNNHFDIYVVQKNSMENTLFHGDIIVVERFYCKKSIIDNSLHSRFFFKYVFEADAGHLSSARKNDVIVFKHKNGTFVVKRCLAEPLDKFIINRDTIFFLCNKKNTKVSLFLSKLAYANQFIEVDTIKNQVGVLNEPLDIAQTKDNTSLRWKNWYQINERLTNDFMFTIDSNYYYMIGDNMSESFDSRHYGPIHEENILGKAIFVLFNYHKGKFKWNRFFKRLNKK